IRQLDVFAAATSRDEVRFSHGFPFYPSLIKSRGGPLRSADALIAKGFAGMRLTVIHKKNWWSSWCRRRHRRCDCWTRARITLFGAGSKKHPDSHVTRVTSKSAP